MQFTEWQRLEQLYYAALEVKEGERASFLDSACPGDPGLRGQVMSLLLNSGDGTSSIEEAIGQAARSFETAPVLDAGQRIGPWKIVRPLGQGGMGSVYLATRADDAYVKEVAIKVVRKDGFDPALIARFRAERQILAHLEHPNIARLLDGGLTESGSPYVVMEYAAGVHIDEYVTRNQLSLEARLHLFRTVCAAVSFAHRNLVIHRDIKPNNILVTADAVVKLLDFGIAKLQGGSIPGITIPMTRESVRMLTPEYASPEQVRGQEVSTATDVYSLGALLYKLLTGAPPHQIDTASSLEMERIICESEPEKPSTVAKRNGLPYSQKLTGDIDNIVLKAVHKDAARRYGSVDRLDEDVRLYLTGFPVQARPDTVTYRARKFAARHRASASLATVLALVLIGSTAGALLMAGRLRRERDAAALEQAKAEQTANFLINVFRVSDPSQARGNSVTAREVLDQASERIGRELKGQPKTRAAMLETLGGVYGNLGIQSRSLALYEASLDTTRRSFPAGDAAVAQSEYELAASLVRGDMDFPRAVSLARQSLEARRKLFGERSREVADCLDLLGDSERAQARFEPSRKLLNEAYQIRLELLGEENLDTAASLFHLANLEYIQQKFGEAETLFRRCYEIRLKLLDRDDPRVLDLLEPLGDLLERKGDLTGAEDAYRKVLDARRRMLKAPNPEIATSIDHLAQVLHSEQKDRGVAALYREAIDNMQGSMGEWNIGTGTILNSYAEWLRTQFLFSEAEAAYRKSLAICEKTLGEEHPYTATVEDNLAVTLVSEHRGAEARRWEEKSLASRRRHYGEMNVITARSLNHLGRVFDSLGNRPEAERLYREANDVAHEARATNDSIRSATRLSLATALERKEQWVEAAALLEGALTMRRKLYGAEAWQTAEVESELGGCLTRLKRYEEARPLLQHGYAVLRVQHGDRPGLDARAQELLANAGQGGGRVR